MLYIIVTSSAELADEARKGGAQVINALGITPKHSIPQKKDDEVIRLLNWLAFKPNLKGYDYLHFILDKCKNDSDYHHRSLTVRVYPECAKHFGTTSSRVERAVRHSVEVSYNQVPNMYEELFGLQYKPKNGELISKISNRLQYV